mmetsp:Transcript_998/g.3052  ORF Transcript_998/g.3052 Transcript_998/m.3052 type:complete len:152 (-) Transcript_998:320-775(-)|eukprot:CAMPEP_0206135080 /NCGR_PEP_ID=MMETSP1473-20131121/442_1 /ASSEMBLY_ACC=CAM_ASM_001109 /TAXON_ID=1461547 /ORGANISM="Stichococcus sp, Strain RCC1054" /LENGTH=151 /DNA_ID=CAMNT_0053526795 /DNA_START=129 /DNA_END=584 /DNA_ORIENTATION=-
MSAAEGKPKAKTTGVKRKKQTGAGADTLDGDRGNVQKRRGLFAKDLKVIMYGYGDAEQPLPATVDLVEDIVVDYVTVMMHKAMDASMKRGKLDTEDLVQLVRKDPQKFGRVKELLVADSEIKAAKKSFEEDEEIEKGVVKAVAAKSDAPEP